METKTKDKPVSPLLTMKNEEGPASYWKQSKGEILRVGKVLTSLFWFGFYGTYRILKSDWKTEDYHGSIGKNLTGLGISAFGTVLCSGPSLLFLGLLGGAVKAPWLLIPAAVAGLAAWRTNNLIQKTIEHLERERAPQRPEDDKNKTSSDAPRNG